MFFFPWFWYQSQQCLENTPGFALSDHPWWILGAKDQTWGSHMQGKHPIYYTISPA